MVSISKYVKYGFLVGGWLFLTTGVMGQKDFEKKRLHIDGEIVTALVNGSDTLVLYELPEVKVKAKRVFNSPEDYRKYRKYMRYAKVVFPYAIEGMKTYQQIEADTKDMGYFKRRRYINKLNKSLKKNYKDPLKKLTKTQGYILVKMIEKELGVPFYQVIKGTRGTVTATYYSTLGRFYGYHLKKGYLRDEDPILDLVLEDFNIIKAIEREKQCD